VIEKATRWVMEYGRPGSSWEVNRGGTLECANGPEEAGLPDIFTSTVSETMYWLVEVSVSVF
jgi:hypothetical protein